MRELSLVNRALQITTQRFYDHFFLNNRDLLSQKYHKLNNASVKHGRGKIPFQTLKSKLYIV